MKEFRKKPVVSEEVLKIGATPEKIMDKKAFGEEMSTASKRPPSFKRLTAEEADNYMPMSKEEFESLMEKGRRLSKAAESIVRPSGGKGLSGRRYN